MIKLTLEMPESAAKRLIALLTSDTPEGAAARKDLNVVSVQTQASQCDCFSMGVHNCPEHSGGRI